ncbi:hypothetical protein A9267_09840 [Shewanella sp. UCD-FRSSP16_17]|uniref:hypothetical protein n=1 Tax=Shewanella sp. UCD-FRSSP16_17 TaxID=1853256 RepID=UPI0007EED1DF|nr:hypothetical protein [Shewanella sp. UCD-FRSSP16_17]OBT09279.1 hypothetical protein A9267_09840 [Shewanella sp. UCD-FRSSP16_17]
MKDIRVFFSCLNFSFNKKGRKTAKASLMHSLRLNNPSGNGIPYLGNLQKYFRTKDELHAEWDTSLSDSNLIDTPEGIVPLSTVSQAQREAILLDVMGKTTQHAGNYEQTSKAKSKSKAKLNKWASDVKTPRQVADLFTRCITSSAFIDANEVSAEYNQFELDRKNQKHKQLINYINLHNALIEKPKTLNSTNFQELLFKIPVKHGVNSDEMSHVEMMNAMKLYLKTFYLQYPIKLMVLHHGERLPEENTRGMFTYLFLVKTAKQVSMIYAGLKSNV